MRRPVRSCCSPAPTARARPRCSDSSPASCPSTPVKRPCWVTTWRTTARGPVASSRSSGTRPSVTTTSPCARTCISRRARPGGAPRKRTFRSSGSGSRARPTSCTGACRWVSNDAWRSRSRCRATRSCCCSTNPTQGSTSKGVRFSTRSCRRHPPKGAPCCSRRTSSTTPVRWRPVRSCSPSGQAKIGTVDAP